VTMRVLVGWWLGVAEERDPERFFLYV